MRSVKICILTTFIEFIHLCFCVRLHIPVRTWQTEDTITKSLTHLAYVKETDALFIGAVNSIYHLKGEDLQLMARIITGPNSATNNNNTILLVNKTADGSMYLTTCSSTELYCAKRNISDGTMIAEIIPPVWTDNAVAFTAVQRELDFSFLACPHSHEPRSSQDACSRPGLKWRAYHRDRNTYIEKEIEFKAFEETNIVTKRYIGSSVIGDFRIFFSIQENKEIEEFQTRIAQICQPPGFLSASGPKSEHTYADMVLRCGNFTILTDVEKYETENEHVFVAVFTDKEQRGSGICVYTFSVLKTKLVDNIKRCYRGQKVSGDDDYIKEADRRCSRNSTASLTNVPEDTFLCNKNKFQSYISVIGEIGHTSEPVLKYDRLILTSVTVTRVGDELVTFLGTDRGDIRKAVVYPRNSARKLSFRVMVANLESINPDMFIDKDKENVYAMTPFKVAKIPVQTCSDYHDCRRCLSSRDPHCGWCILDFRCTTNSSCTTSWIPSSGNSSCLSMEISPKAIQVPVTPNTPSVQITLSLPLPELQNAYCHYHLRNPVQRGAVLPAGNTTAERIHEGAFSCVLPELNSLVPKIRGYTDLIVSITEQFSTRPVAKEIVKLYNCVTFHSCSSCKNKLWSCDWCAYDNECVVQGVPCRTEQLNMSLSDCPTVFGVDENSLLLDDKHNLYLPDHDDTDILVNGTNLLEPLPGKQYTCQIPDITSQPAQATWNRTNPHQVQCHFRKEFFQLKSGKEVSKLQLKLGNSTVDGNDITVIVYHCEDLVAPSNCDKCKSFAIYQPFYKCHWCENQCVFTASICSSGDVTRPCPNPSISEVFPLKIHSKTPKVRIDLSGLNLGSVFNETIDSVTVGNMMCTSLQPFFKPSEKISCELEGPAVDSEVNLTISLPDRQPVSFHHPVVFKIPNITSVFPTLGPISGGTKVTIYGTNLDLGRTKGALIGNSSCTFVSIVTGEMVCKTTSSATTSVTPLPVSIVIDGTKSQAKTSFYSYVADPVILSISPRKSFHGGGRRLTVSGTNLDAIQKPMVFTRNIEDGRTSTKEECERDVDKKVIYCPSPGYASSPGPNPVWLRYRKREIDTKKEIWLIGFEMDDVQSVRDLPENQARIFYVQNPEVKLLPSNQKYNKILIIKGERMGMAASLSDIGVRVGQEKCNVTRFSNETIECNPPVDKPEFNQSSKTTVPVEVHIGYLRYDVGELDYKPIPTYDSDDSGLSDEYAIAGSVVGVLVLVMLILIIAMIVIIRKRKSEARKNEDLMHQMDNLEATVYKQCREEFAALQTTMSDLTSDLEGGNVLFRDYESYACKVLFTDELHPVMSAPIAMSDSLVPALDAFKGLLKNKDFVLLFIRTLEQQKQSFTIQDRSNVASLLMTIHSDNMEYITDLLKTLLKELIDQTIAAQRAKLLLRRSESVVEKLVTHWLSICLYHYLKEHTGSAMFILYKAIKVQIEKGPLDYITGCAKYTLSEAKLLPAGDADINAKSLALQVHHFDYISDKDQNITVQVLDCDTITQTKSKILDVVYKNIPYSERPYVHKTLLEIKESDGTQRMLHDEDASNEKEGVWKKLNTLQHYNVKDGAELQLTTAKENEMSMLSASESPDSFIVGSIKRSKQVKRTISGSNFWHLTKQHNGDEKHLSSEIFLPRLLNTKGTLQTYIDDLFAEILRVGEEPPLIIKYLFDFLDVEAARHGITDPDTLHTWKCNSLLLRFWVNLIKNPEFVFDIHKPPIVDSCLSVITQTLMDSCSTAALRLGKDSPSNKLLFAKDISRYKESVTRFFQEIKDKPAVSDQDLNCYLTEKVSQKFGGKLYASSALLEMYKFASKYKDEIMAEVQAKEIPVNALSEQNHDTPLLMKFQQLYTLMAGSKTTSKLETSGSTKPRKSS